MEIEKLKINEVIVRPIRAEEYPMLEDFLYDAIFQPGGSELLPKEIIHQPELYVYISNFGESGDVCFVAESERKAVGAVWTRILSGKVPGYGNIDDSTPEFAISVKKEYRGQGIGKRLMKEMILFLKEQGIKRASLSVDKENYAFHMYEKLGFHVLEERDGDYLMVLDLEKMA